jgi:hypothetical protein
MSEVIDMLDALFATLQRAEYRTPYTVPARWPLYDCPHDECVDMDSFGGPPEYLCKACSAVLR